MMLDTHSMTKRLLQSIVCGLQILGSFKEPSTVKKCMSAINRTLWLLIHLHEMDNRQSCVKFQVTCANMAGRVVFRCSWIFLSWLLLTLVLNSLKYSGSLDKKIKSLFVAKGLHVKHYPTRNVGSSRRFRHETTTPSSLECMAGLKIANITLCATYLVLLARDIQQNPGPVKEPCAVCKKGCRRHEKAIQCDLCDKWHHSKCIDMKKTGYDELRNPSKAWQCMECLFPGFDTHVRNSHPCPNPNKEERDGTVRTELNPNLKKRGLKLAHVNLVTFLGNYADVEVWESQPRSQALSSHGPRRMENLQSPAP